MAISYQTSTKVNFGASPRVINKPTGTVDNDLLVLIMVNSNSAVTVSTPSGWTLIQRFQSSVSNHTINCFYKTASSEGSSYSITTPGDNTCGILLRIDGQEVSSPYLTANSGELSNSANPSINASITPSITNSLLVMVTSCNIVGSPTGMSNYAITTSNPTWTEREEIDDATYGNVGVATALRPETTATGNLSFSNGGSSTTDNSAMIMAFERAVTQSYSFSETINTIETSSYIRNRIINIAESITSSETYTNSVNKIRNVAKNISSWINTYKS